MKLCKSAITALEMLHEAFGEHFLIQTVVFEWYSRFKTSRKSVEDEHLG
jgi:hypothetical protein